MYAYSNRRKKWQRLLCWLVFGAGLLVQLLAPRLEISDGAFVIPTTLTAGEKNIRPIEIVRTERRMQLISGILTLSGALGLAFSYRDVLLRSVSRRSNKTFESSLDGLPHEASVQTKSK